MKKKLLPRRAVVLLLTVSLLWTVVSGVTPAARAAYASRQVRISIADVTCCDIYYSTGGALVPIREGESITEVTIGPYGILFFAAPHKGYALSAMSASATAGNYFTISNGQADGTGSEFYQYELEERNLQDNAGFSLEQLRAIMTEAIAKGCDGALLFSRGAYDSGGISSNLMFCAEKLPTLEKRIVSVTPKGGTKEPYAPGMSVGLGDQINYALDVTFYQLANKTFSIDYTNVFITDEKTGNDSAHPISVAAPSAEELKRMNEDRVITYPVSYTICQGDVVQGSVVNEAQLAYRYRSLHSAGQFSTTSDARAEITVHSSVTYRYESGTEGMELPPELAALAPADYGYYDQGDWVTAPPHRAESPFWDEANGGYWTLQGGGGWSGTDGSIIADGGSFLMPGDPVSLAAVWTFTGAPAIAVEKDGSIQKAAAPEDAAEGSAVEYTAAYILTVQNTGGETLTGFSLRDETLPADPGAITAEVGDSAAALQNAAWDEASHTLTFDLPGGLPAGGTLTLSYRSARTGALGYKLLLTDESAAEVAAKGGQTGVLTRDSAALSIQTVLETRILLIPADIVIYAGGDRTGSNVAPGTNLPEPGFFVVLPLEAEQTLREVLKAVEQIDLSPYLTFTDSDGNVWGLELFCGGYSKAHGSFLYRLVPRRTVEGGQESIQMQFYDEEQQKNILQSEFDITNALQQEYEMTIYPGEIPAVDPKALLTVETTQVGAYDLGVSPGKLTIRGTTEERTTTAIQSAEPETVTQITACAEDPAVRYYINQSLLEADPGSVALLVDHIVDEAYGRTLQTLAAPVLSAMDNQGLLRCQFRYLDLVDTSMGNAWITASAPLQILWPYPDGTDREDRFTVIHYRGMDRDYDLEDMAGLRLGTDYTLEIYTNGEIPEEVPAYVTYRPLTAGEAGLSFAAQDFSPYALVWEGTPESGGGVPETPKAPEGPAGLNTADHIAYLIGRDGRGVQPLAAITRAEVATVFFRLLTDEARTAHWSTADRYADVAAQSWYHNAVATMTEMGVLQGDPGGTFRPGDPVTRAEFAAIAVRFFQTPEAETAADFADVPDGAWYADAVEAGAALGLLLGREDGTFGPEEPITRAEAAAIVNRMLGRGPRTGPLPEGADRWTDNPPEAWYYEDMLEASVGHDYQWLGRGEDRAERWTALQKDRDWAALEQNGSTP